MKIQGFPSSCLADLNRRPPPYQSQNLLFTAYRNFQECPFYKVLSFFILHIFYNFLSFFTALVTK
nr:MAG TPA: hypothetical protein [Caudoviricetes sp.]